MLCHAPVRLRFLYVPELKRVFSVLRRDERTIWRRIEITIAPLSAVETEQDTRNAQVIPRGNDHAGTSRARSDVNYDD